MDPLTIFGAVAGAIGAATDISEALGGAISKVSQIRQAPETAVNTLRDVQMMRRNLVRFKQLETNASIPHGRLSYIPLRDAKNTFVDCVAVLDELETLVGGLADPSLDSMSLSSRMQWVAKEQQAARLTTRLGNAQNSLALMLTIMQCESMIEVKSAVADLARVTKQIASDLGLQGDAGFAGPSGADDQDDTSTIRPSVPRPDSVILASGRNRDDSSSIYSERSRRWPIRDSLNWASAASTPARFEFEDDLETSRAYRRIPRWSRDDITFDSSLFNDHALSYLSKISLGDVSSMSVIALPIFKEDISNRRHYKFGGSSMDNVMASPQIGQQTLASETIPSGDLPAWSSEASSYQRRGSPSQIEMSPLDGGEEQPTTKIPRSLFPLQLDSPKSPRPGRDRLPSPVPSLGQLSEISLNSEIYLCHRVGGPPCFGVVKLENDIQKDGASEFLDQAMAWQVELAAKNGFLDYFRCKTCDQSMSHITTSAHSKLPSLELWCGEDDCIQKHAPDYEVCPCYQKLKGIGQSKKFYGCRRLGSAKIQCARCFDRCYACAQSSQATRARAEKLQARAETNAAACGAVSLDDEARMLRERMAAMFKQQSGLIDSSIDTLRHMELDGDDVRLIDSHFCAVFDRPTILENRHCIANILQLLLTARERLSESEKEKAEPKIQELKHQFKQAQEQLKHLETIEADPSSCQELVNDWRRLKILHKRRKLILALTDTSDPAEPWEVPSLRKQFEETNAQWEVLNAAN